MRKAYIGVDIGVAGGLCAIGEDDKIIDCVVMPTMEIIVNKKKKNQYDLQAINLWIIKMTDTFQCCAIMERLRPMPSQMSQTAFSLGYGTAIFETLFTVHGIKFEKIEARKWQQNMFTGFTYTKDQTKVISIQVAKTMEPSYDWRATERCKVAHDGKTDSYLLSIYLRITCTK